LTLPAFAEGSKLDGERRKKVEWNCKQEERMSNEERRGNGREIRKRRKKELANPGV
jgi:hypothetical protein